MIRFRRDGLIWHLVMPIGDGHALAVHDDLDPLMFPLGKTVYLVKHPDNNEILKANES